MIVGASELTATATKIRQLMHFGQTLQSHALHFFHLCSPDLLFGFDDDVRHRNIVGLIEDSPEIAKQGVLLRKYGQEVIRITSGKRIHGTGAIPGGIIMGVLAYRSGSLLWPLLFHFYLGLLNTWFCWIN